MITKMPFQRAAAATTRGQEPPGLLQSGDGIWERVKAALDPQLLELLHFSWLQWDQTQVLQLKPDFSIF